MAEKADGEVNGTWLRGADGDLYCIPDADLEAYRVPDDDARAALAAIDEGDEVGGFEAGRPEINQAKFSPIIAQRALIVDHNVASGPAIVPPPAELRGLRWQQQT
jgi:hypothetical protein